MRSSGLRSLTSSYVPPQCEASLCWLSNSLGKSQVGWPGFYRPSLGTHRHPTNEVIVQLDFSSQMRSEHPGKNAQEITIVRTKNTFVAEER
jgi:hypothetical protein